MTTNNTQEINTEAPKFDLQDGTYQLGNHPGFDHHRPFGLLMRGLLTEDSTPTYFDFDHPDSDVRLEINGSQVRVYGTTFGGIEAGDEFDPDNSGLFEIDITYDNVEGVANDDDLHLTAENAKNSTGTITQLYGEEKTFDLKDEDGNFGYSFRLGDTESGEYRDYDGTSGWGWLTNSSEGSKGDFHFIIKDEISGGNEEVPENPVPEQPILEDGTYQLNNHPDGVAANPTYGLRLDGLLTGDNNDIVTFDFEHPDADVRLEVNGSQVRIYGTAFGGIDTGTEYDPDNSGLFEIDFTYNNVETAAGDDDFIVTEANARQSTGTIRQLFGEEQTFDLTDEDGKFDYSFRLGDTDNDQGHRGFDGTSGFGWLNYSEDGGGDWLFTVGEQITTETPVENTAPDAIDDAVTVESGRAVGIRVLSNDTDADGDVLGLQSFTQGNNGRVVRHNNGTAGDTSDDRLVYRPNKNFVGTDTFTYTVSDGNGGFDTAEVTVNVGEANTAPEAIADTASAVAGRGVVISVLNNDHDPDGDTIRLISATQGSNGRVLRHNNGTRGDTSDDRLVYIPNEGFTGEDTFTYRIGDGRGGFDTAEVTVTVDGANTAPVAVDDSVTIDEGRRASIRVLDNDSDPDGDTLRLVTATQGSNGRVVRHNNGTVGDLSDDRLIYTANEGFTGTDSFTYTIADGRGGFDTAEVTVTVGGEVVETPATGIIGGQVWHDRHPNDGIQDIDDVNYEAGGFRGAVVNLYTEGGELVDSTISGTAGFYEFSDVTAGSYYVEFDVSNSTLTKERLDGTVQYSRAPEGRTWRYTSAPNAGDDEARDSDITSGISTQVAQRTDAFELQAGEVNRDIGAAVTPLALDLNGDGIQTLSIDEGVEFDLLNTGNRINTGWLSGEDAFLAIDNNQNGQIDDRSELFGGVNVGDGFAKLNTFDSNDDGFINELDERFSELLVWQDANENGVTDSGELISLIDSGITNLGTDFVDVFRTDAQGNIHGEHSSAELNGNTIDLVDVYFQVDA